MAIARGAEPYFLPGGEQGVLLVHGFTGSPSDMRMLGDFLHNLGYTVLAPRLAGHGTHPADMAVTRWPHWYAAAEDGYHLLRGFCRDISVVGLSMGGLIALQLAAEQQVKKVVSLSAPIYIADKRLPLLPVYRMFRKFVPQQRRQYAGHDNSFCYDCTPLDSLNSLLEYIKKVDKLLPLVTVPVLLVQSRNDHTVKPESVQHIYKQLSSACKEIQWLKRSGHIVTLDMERDRAFEIIADFLEG